MPRKSDAARQRKNAANQTRRLALPKPAATERLGPTRAEIIAYRAAYRAWQADCLRLHGGDPYGGWQHGAIIVDGRLRELAPDGTLMPDPPPWPYAKEEED